MNPLQMIMQMAGQGVPGAAAATSATSGGQPMAPATGATDQLGAILGAVQGQQPATTPLPYTTTPDAPRAINPEFSNQIMQLMMSINQPKQMPTLGALLGGRA